MCELSGYRVVVGGISADLILEDAAVLRRTTFLDHLKSGVVLHPGNEDHFVISPLAEQPIVVVTPIADYNCIRREAQLLGGLDVTDESPEAAEPGAETDSVAGRRARMVDV